MRDLNECKAEVFRRSENRIKQRKRRRNRVLSLCIPLCLVVGALLLLPELAPNRKGTESNKVQDETSASIVCTYTRVEILNAGQELIEEKTVTDKVEVTKLFNALGACFPTDDGGQKGPSDSKAPGIDTAATAVKIVFTDDEGNRETYILNDYFLSNPDKNEAVVLSTYQRDQLVAALGLACANK